MGSRNTMHPLKEYDIKQARKGKILDAHEAVEIIKDGDVIATGGFVGNGFPEEIAVALEERFMKTESPRDLTLFFAAGQGDGNERGLNHLAHEVLIKRIVGGHYGLVPKIQKLVIDNIVEAYNLPQGILTHMLRDAGAHKPRTISSVGLGTYIDPRNGGGKINARTTEDIVELMEFDGCEYLAYKTQPIDVAIIRGTTADTDGNITMEREALTLESLALAIAAKNNGGFVIAQVERIAERGMLKQREVKIPGIMVDCVVVASDPKYHMQTFGVQYNPAFASEFKVPLSSIEPLPLDARKVIARRACLELVPNSVVNLGIGMPEGVANVAAEESVLELMTLTAEPGVIGGVPAGGLSFGAASNVDALIDQPYQFDFYDGGGLDIAFLGLAQADREGNLNVSKFGTRLAGCGGFINISQNAKKVVFLGTFTAGGLDVSITDGVVNVRKEGKVQKFVSEVEQKTFAGRLAARSGQPVFYITERCVFKLTEQGVCLIEVAPGIDIERHIISCMGFEPLIAKEPGQMDARIFRPELMKIRGDLLSVPLEKRLTYHKAQGIFYVNFESLTIRSKREINEIRERIDAILGPIGKKVKTVVNYDNFDISPELIDPYMDMVKAVVKDYYSDVTRYTTSTFMRMKLGDSLKQRGVAPHIFESQDEATAALKG